MAKQQQSTEIAAPGGAGGRQIAYWLTTSVADAILPEIDPLHRRAGMETLRSAAIAIVENDKLQQAMKTPQGRVSLSHALRKAVRWGCSLNPQDGEAALVPYKDQIQYLPMKNGLIRRILETGRVASVETGVVRENDRWDLRKRAGADYYEFAPARKNRGAVDGYWAAIHLHSGETHAEYMTQTDVQEHAKRFASASMQKPDSPWNKNFDSMAEKTVVKSLLRRVSIAPEVDRQIRELIDRNDDDAIDRNDDDAIETTARGTAPDDLTGAINHERGDQQVDPDPAAEGHNDTAKEHGTEDQEAGDGSRLF